MCELLFNTSLHLFPNNWLRDPSIELDHPPKTSIMMHVILCDPVSLELHLKFLA